MRPFGLVLSCGGARGFAHVGVLRALNHFGYYPSVIVGVSMGAIVGATYALNDHWYEDLVAMDTTGFPGLPDLSERGVTALIRNLIAAERAISEMYFGWGIGQQAMDWGYNLLASLTLDKRLEDGRIPVFAAATDILSGKRVVLREGRATDALVASSAIAGILPPTHHGMYLLIDGGYADMAPVDVVWDAGVDLVIAVDPFASGPVDPPKNGIQAMLRSIEICQNEHARLRFEKADLVLRPDFGRPIATLDFRFKRDCIAAGVHAVRQAIAPLRQLLGGPARGG
jgi:NTE family protein